MSARVGEFVGQRLRDARLARGMTASALAEEVGIKPSSVSRYEHNGGAPRPDVLARIAETLRLPQSHFLRPALDDSGRPYWYRSLASATKKARAAAQVRLGWLREMVLFVEDLAHLPEIDLPDLHLPEDPAAIDSDDLEEAAQAVRRAWSMGDGPIGDIVALLESKGIIVSRFAFSSEQLDAFSHRAPERPYVALNSDKESGPRSRFDAAHELAHLVLHRGVDPRRFGEPSFFKMLEGQAHRFAGAFLFPSAAFSEEVFSLAPDSLAEVKVRWGVSYQMTIRRAYDLKLISKHQYERAFMRLSRSGQRKRERLDDEIDVEYPSMIRRALEVLFEGGALTREDLLYHLPYGAADLEVLCALPRGYLEGKDWGAIRSFSPRPREERKPSKQGGEVVPLRGRSRRDHTGPRK